MNITRTLAAGSLASALFAGALAAAPAASAKGIDVRTSGTCSIASTWKIKAKAENSRIQVELEVDQNRVGKSWSVVMKDNGVQVYSGTSVTTAPSGSFNVSRTIANRAGTDTITATARNAATGELCSARVVYPG